MKKLFFAITLVFLTLNSSLAKEVFIDVNGLVCEFCAVTIEKSLMKKKDLVKTVKVDLETKKVTIDFFDGKNLTDQEITQIIKDNGYNVEKINR